MDTDIIPLTLDFYWGMLSKYFVQLDVPRMYFSFYIGNYTSSSSSSRVPSVFSSNNNITIKMEIVIYMSCQDIYMYDIIFYGENCLPVFLTLRKFDPRETPLSKDCDISIIQAKEVNEAFWKEPRKDRYHKRNVSISLSNFTVECSEYHQILFPLQEPSFTI